MPADSSASKEVGTAALLVIGGKILSGRTKDQNIGYVAECLTAVGIDLKEVRVVGDEERPIVDAMRSAPLGMRVMRRRASFISAPVVFTHSCRMASARGSVSIGTPNAFATQSAVMSLWVGPIPPVVKT